MYKVKIHKVSEIGGCLFTEDIKGWCFPNFFSKEHFEDFMGKKLTDTEFEVLSERVKDSLCDSISQDVSAFLADEGENILREVRNDDTM